MQDLCGCCLSNLAASVATRLQISPLAVARLAFFAGDSLSLHRLVPGWHALTGTWHALPLGLRSTLELLGTLLCVAVAYPAWSLVLIVLSNIGYVVAVVLNKLVAIALVVLPWCGSAPCTGPPGGACPCGNRLRLRNG